MPALSDYTAGTITLTNGSVNFTGAGTGWQAADFREGDTILGIEDNAGVEYVIATITGNGAGTLTQEWEGATGTYTYRMRYMADGARVTAQARNLIELLGNGNLQAEAGIDGTGGNWLSYFTGAGTKARTPFTAKGRAVLAATNNSEVLTEIGAQPAGDYQPAGNYVTNSMPTARVKGRVTAGTGAVEDLTQTQVRTFLGMSSFFTTLLDDADGAALYASMGATAGPAYVKLPDGFIMQWGSENSAAPDYVVTLPVAFTSINLGVFPAAVADFAGWAAYTVTADQLGLNSFVLRCRYIDSMGPTGAPNLPVRWFAIGR